jgi:hypothetical protein
VSSTAGDGGTTIGSRSPKIGGDTLGSVLSVGSSPGDSFDDSLAESSVTVEASLS